VIAAQDWRQRSGAKSRQFHHQRSGPGQCIPSLRQEARMKTTLIVISAALLLAVALGG